MKNMMRQIVPVEQEDEFLEINAEERGDSGMDTCRR